MVHRFQIVTSCRLSLLVIFLAALSSFSVATNTTTICNDSQCRALSDELRHRSMNLTVDPCVDFYSFVCGNWPTYHPANDAQMRRDAASEITAKVNRKLIEALADTNHHSSSSSVRYVSQLYRTCNATAATRNTEPLHRLIRKVLGGEWPLLLQTTNSTSTKVNNETWRELFTRMVIETAYTPIFAVGLTYDQEDRRQILLFGYAATGLLWFDYDSNEAQANNSGYHAYLEFIRETAIEMGAKDDHLLTERLNKTIELEKSIAEVSFNSGSML